MIERIFIAGAGLMGGGIAQVALAAGYSVVLYDSNPAQLQKAAAEIDARLERRVTKGAMGQSDKQACMEKLTTSPELEAAAGCHMVIEAVYENVQVKTDLLGQLDKVCSANAIIASNTSSFSITRLATAVSFPRRFVGVHFFSPVPVMKLVELIRGMKTGDDTYQEVRKVCERMGKVCIDARDSPAFAMSRMLDMLVNEAVQLVYEGAATVEDIDAGARLGLNHPMGQLELADMAGVDILLEVMHVMHEGFGDPKYRPCPMLHQMIAAGFCGRKAGAGFYLYNEKGEKLGPNPALLNW